MRAHQADGIGLGLFPVIVVYYKDALVAVELLKEQDGVGELVVVIVA